MNDFLKRTGATKALRYLKGAALLTLIAIIAVSCSEGTVEQPANDTGAQQRADELTTISNSLDALDKRLTDLNTIELDKISIEISEIDSILNSTETSFNSKKNIASFSESSIYTTLKNIVTEISSEISRINSDLDDAIEENYIELISNLLDGMNPLLEEAEDIATAIDSFNEEMSSLKSNFESLSDDDQLEALNTLTDTGDQITARIEEIKTEIESTEKKFEECKDAAGKTSENSSDNEIAIAANIESLNTKVISLTEEVEASLEKFQETFGAELNNPEFKISSYVTITNDTIAYIEELDSREDSISTSISDFQASVESHSDADFTSIDATQNALINIVSSYKKTEDAFIASLETLIIDGEALLALYPDAKNVDALNSAIEEMEKTKTEFGDGLSSELSTQLDTEIEKLDEKRVEKSEDIITLQTTELDAINLTLTEINTEITSYNTDLDNGINVDRADVEATKAKIEALSLSNIESETDKLIARMAAIGDGSEKDDLTVKYNTLKTLLSTVDSEIDTALNNVDAVLEGLTPELSLAEWQEGGFDTDAKLVINDDDNSIVLGAGDYAQFIAAIKNMEIEDVNGIGFDVSIFGANMNSSEIVELYNTEVEKDCGMILELPQCTISGEPLDYDVIYKMFERDGIEVNPNNVTTNCGINWKNNDFDHNNVSFIENRFGPTTLFNSNINGTLKTRVNSLMGEIRTTRVTEDIITFDETTTTIESLKISAVSIAGVASFLNGVGLSEQKFLDNIDNVVPSISSLQTENNGIYGFLNESGDFAPGMETACKLIQHHNVEANVEFNNQPELDLVDGENVPVIVKPSVMNKLSDYGINIRSIGQGIVILHEDGVVLNIDNSDGREVTGGYYICLSDIDTETLMNANSIVAVNITVDNISGSDIIKIGNVTFTNSTTPGSYTVDTTHLDPAMQKAMGLEGYDAIPVTLQEILDWANSLKNVSEVTELADQN